MGQDDPRLVKADLGRFLVSRGETGGVNGSFDVNDVLGGASPPWTLLVRRGLHRQCPRCAGSNVFVTRWRLKERCPGCGYLFQREPGFFLGAWFLNFMVLEILHFVLVMAFILWKSGHPEAGLLLPLGVGLVTAVVLPIVLYPWSQSTWAAIDLAMTPLELKEIVEAADAVAAGPGGPALPGSD